MKNVFKKSLMAAAISTAVVAGSAHAVVDLAFSGAGETVVLANVIFGEGNPGAGSEETLITAPESTFDLDTTAAGVGDDGTMVSLATVKFTLGGGAVFGEDLSTTALVDAANGAAGAFFLTTATAVAYQVVQGGAIGDNTITFELTFAADGNILDSVTFVGYKVKNLTSALKPSSASPRVQLGVEYVESTDFAADTINVTATDTPLTIFGSQDPLDLVGVPVDFFLTPFTRINVGASEALFTGTTADGRTDFDPANDTDFVELGTLQLNLENINLVAFPLAGAGKIKKENGDDFDFQGGDTHVLTFTAGSGSFQTLSRIYLADFGSDCNLGVATADLAGASDIATDGVFQLAVSGNTTALTAAYEVCYEVDGTTDIPEVSDISAAWDVVFFNVRYDNPELSYTPFGPLVRNGCVASLFNLPGADNATDSAFIRLTNTSTTNTGDIRGTLYAQDGTVLGEDVIIAPDLAPHATQVFHGGTGDITAATGQVVISIPDAFTVDGTGDTYEGRARLVLKGAFDTCEAMGLIRNSSTGALFNMTSTTQGNEAAAPNDGNNAQ